jgi:uncharacterized repeat protein (TIGR03803 family)
MNSERLSLTLMCGLWKKVGLLGLVLASAIASPAQTTELVLHNFGHLRRGAYPYAGVLRDAGGNLYGTTISGGPANAGLVYKVDTAGHQSVLYSFTGGADGSSPRADLIGDPQGILYGTTAGGGQTGNGVVFKVDITGHETVLYSFTGGADGYFPADGCGPRFGG